MNINKYVYLLIIVNFLFSHHVNSETLYINDKYGYEITLPEDWMYEEESIDHLLIKHTDDNGVKCSLIIEEENVNIEEAEELVKFVKEGLFVREGSSSIFSLDKLQAKNLNHNVPAVNIIISQKLKREVAERLNIKSEYVGKETGVFSIKDNLGYYLRCKDTIDNQEKYKIEFESILNSFNYIYEK